VSVGAGDEGHLLARDEGLHPVVEVVEHLRAVEVLGTGRRA
jgi:hypothetical protein